MRTPSIIGVAEIGRQLDGDGLRERGQEWAESSETSQRRGPEDAQRCCPAVLDRWRRATRGKRVSRPEENKPLLLEWGLFFPIDSPV